MTLRHGAHRFALAALLAALALGTALLLLGTAERAEAHPLGNFTTNRYARLELYRGQVRLVYALDFAEIPTFQLGDSLDADGDGNRSTEELEGFARRTAEALPSGFELRSGEAAVPLRPATAHAQLVEGLGGLETLRFDAVFEARIDAEAGEVRFTDDNYADRFGWHDLVVKPSEGTVASVPEALLIDRSDALRAYPEGETVPRLGSARFEWTSDSGAEAPALPASQVLLDPLEPPSGAGGRFAALLGRERTTLTFLASLVAAFGFGAFHALGPGHGKAMIGAYLVGSRGTVRQALLLGLTVTTTHTSMVYALGFVTILASAYVLPEVLFGYLGVASGLGVVAMGVGLLIGRSRKLRRAPEGTHRHGLVGRPHSHEPAGEAPRAAPEVVTQRTAALAWASAPSGGAAGAHLERHAHPHPRPGEREPRAHVHPHTDHGHERSPTATDEPRLTRRGLLALGILGGLLPCPSALVVMLAAISLGQVLYGMALIVAFSFGLASVLVAVGIAVVLSGRAVDRVQLPAALRSRAVARLARALPVASALGVTVAGALILVQALQQVAL